MIQNNMKVEDGEQSLSKEYKKLFESLKNKTGFSSDEMKSMASKEIIIEFLNWADKIIKDEKIDSLDLSEDISKHIEFIKSL